MEIRIIDCTPIPYEEREDCITLDKCIYSDKGGTKRINYPMTVRALAGANDLICVNHMLYSPQGYVSDVAMRKDISESLEMAGWTAALDSPTTHILNSVKDLYSQEALPVDKNVIPFANGDLHLGRDSWVFRRGERKQTAYRLSVDFIAEEEREMPWFTRWVNDTFVPDDIKTLQELIAYCLIPVTAAQEAFILVGQAGAGKSVLTHLLASIFGNAYTELSLKELAENKFYTSLVENKLVVYDDDLKTEALSETGLFKKLVTANQEITAERKFEQPHKFLPYCTIIANSNEMIKTLYDDSNGFYRRLHPLHIKDKQPGRENIANMAELVAGEREAVIRWALRALPGLQARDYRIHWSDRSSVYMQQEQSVGLHFPQFFESVFDFSDPTAETTSRQITAAYSAWAMQNAVSALQPRRLQAWIASQAEHYQISKTLIGSRRLSGYRGLKIADAWASSIAF